MGSKKNKYMTSIVKINKCRLKFGGQKSYSTEYNEILNEFIKEGRSHDIAITSSEVIAKALEIIPEFKSKSYDELIHWLKRFRIRYSYSIRKVTKISQSLPVFRSFYTDEILDNIRN